MIAVTGRLRTSLVLVFALIASLVYVTGDAGAEAPQPVEIQILNVSDWHAQLDPLSVSGVNVGGAAAISAHWQQDRAANPNTLTLTAGDAYGAAPPLSGFFDEVPAVLAMRLMGSTPIRSATTTSTAGSITFSR